MIQGMEEDHFKDPVAEQAEADRIRMKAERREEKRRVKIEKKEEEIRLVAEAIANAPPPPVVARVFEFRFKDPAYKNENVDINPENTRLTMNSNKLSIIIPKATCKNEPLTIDDFPEDADDIPGTFDPPSPPPERPPRKKKVKEVEPEPVLFADPQDAEAAAVANEIEEQFAGQEEEGEAAFAELEEQFANMPDPVEEEPTPPEEEQPEE